MGHRSWFVPALFAAGALVFASGCGSSAPPVEADPTPVETPVETETREVTPPVREETSTWVDPMKQYADVFVPIYFEFDKYRITEQAKPKLERIAGLLKSNPDWKVLIEGHCDERGTNEYNLGLGEQRALSTKRYLASLGVTESRFQTISYGEERPADSRSNEEAWAKNRRAEFKVEAPRS